jgi:dGTPase
MPPSPREKLEKLEEIGLLPCAVRSSKSRGREHQEPEHQTRTEFQRDRDRIVYSNAFRRLEYKTQVFPNHEGDHYRTRLTHTIEVANLTRTLCRNLGLNEDFSECLALVHDIGHPPFGHIGETVLNDLMKDHGGFEHNQQTYQIVTKLENSYTAYPGLNLTKEVLEAILQHTKNYRQAFPDAREPLLETRLVSITDEMAYNAHDLEDGLRSGILQEEDVLSLDIMEDIQEHPDFPKREDRVLRHRYLVRQVLNSMVLDFVDFSEKSLEKANLPDHDSAHNATDPILGFSESMSLRKTELEKFLRAKMYRHPKVMKMMNKSGYFLERVFQHFLKFPEELPEAFQERFDQKGKERSVADYLAGMTDRFLQEEYIRLFVPFQKML